MYLRGDRCPARVPLTTPLLPWQVVDARDPLLYRSTDLEAYARELHPTKASVLLLNKADLLSRALRTAWADYFDRQGISYLFWSAKAASEGLLEEGVSHLPTTLHLASLTPWRVPLQNLYFLIDKTSFGGAKMARFWPSSPFLSLRYKTCTSASCIFSTSGLCSA